MAQNQPTLKIVQSRLATEKPVVPKFLPAYQLLGKIGEGRVGLVYLARHRILGRDVAVKVLRRRYTSELDTTRAFLTAAQRAASLRCPATVEVYDLKALEGGGAYIVMELLRGETLRNRLARGGPLSLAEGVSLAGQIATGVCAAHEVRLPHGDLRPENIFLCGGDRTVAKIMDYGISRLRSAADTAVDLFGPGQDTIRDQTSTDFLQDLYAVGEIYYEMFTGCRPFQRRSSTGRTDVRLTPTPLHRVRPDLPRGLVDLIHRMLEPWPIDRLRSAKTLVTILNDITRSGRPTSQVAAGSPRQPTPRPPRVPPRAARPPKIPPRTARPPATRPAASAPRASAAPQQRTASHRGQIPPR